MATSVKEGSYWDSISTFCRKPVVVLLAGTATAAAIANYCFNQDSTTAAAALSLNSVEVLTMAMSLPAALYAAVWGDYCVENEFTHKITIPNHPPEVLVYKQRHCITRDGEEYMTTEQVGKGRLVNFRPYYDYDDQIGKHK